MLLLFLFTNFDVDLIFIFLCAARTLKERSDKGIMKDKTINGDHNQTFKPKTNNNEADHNTEGEVFSMDYTPASRKPPIHN